MSAATEVVKGEFAFWKYDDFLGLLAGEVTAAKLIDSRGLAVQIRGYGLSWFTPIHLMELKKGKSAWVELKKLKTERDDALQVLEDRFTDKLQALKKKHGLP